MPLSTSLMGLYAQSVLPLASGPVDMPTLPPASTNVTSAIPATNGSEEQLTKAINLLTNSLQSGVKFDDGKPRWDLLDSEFLDGIAKVLEFGARKYAPHNWRGGISISRLLGAAGRHFGALLRGQDLDPESGLPHWAHLGCCIMFLSWMITHRKDLDDRYKY